MSEDESLLAGVEPTPSEETAVETPGEEVPLWSLAEGITGEGDKPEWFKDTKYKSVADQAKAYPELESRLGGFTGAPEGDYELSMPDGIEGEWIDGDPLMEGFQTWARDKNLDQGAFTDLLHLYVNNESQMMGTDRESELAAIGDNAQGRLQNISDFAKANLSEDEFHGILAATTTSAGVLAVEKLISLSRGIKIPTGDGEEAAKGMTREEIREQMSDPRYQSDPAFRKKVEGDYKRLLGAGPMNKVVG